MMKTQYVPLDLLAMSQKQKAAPQEVGLPLYLPAYDTPFLGEPAGDDLTAEADFGVEADALVIGYDEDDDFY